MDILVELEYLKPEGGIEAPSPEIKIDIPKKVVPAVIVPKPNTVPKIKVPTKSVTKPKTTNSVKSLFKLEPAPTPVQRTVIKPKPIKVQPVAPIPVKKPSAQPGYEDLF